MVFSNNLLMGAAGAAAGAGYTIDQSIRFNDDDSAYLIRTPSGDGNLKTFTINLWIKISTIDKDKFILEAFAGSGTGEFLVIGSTNKIQLYGDSSGANCNIATTQLFRDPNAWAMLTAAVDTTQATASNRIKLYYNGEQITSFSTASYPTLDKTFVSLNKGSVAQNIGRYGAAGSGYYDGYMAEFCFIDGQALDPTSFGEVNSITGQWIPIDVSGLTFGTNGFHITGEDSADLGADYSGNGNDFTSSGLTSADQMLDTPTDNFCTFSPINTQPSNVTLSDGNLVLSYSGTADTPYTPGTISVSSGKWYWEINSYQGAGAGPAVSYVYTENDTSYSNNTFGYHYTGNFYDNGSSSAYGDSFINTDTIGVALDMDNGAIWFSKNGTWQNSATAAEIAAGTTTNAAKTGISGDYVPIVQRNNGTTSVTANFGQTGGFTYTPPTGFNALSTANLPDPTIALPSDYFQTVLDTGANIKTTAEALYTDQFEWIKDRDNSNNHQLIDSVRGTSAVLQSNSTGAETTYSAPSGNSVAWVWKANGTGSTNTDGSVTSNVSENQAAGFSIATFQKPPADTNETVGHGLGTTPAMTILRWRSGTGGPPSWYVWHQSFSSVGFLRLQGTDAFTADTTVFSSAPSSTVVNTGTAVDSDTNTTEFVMYNFAEVEGFSKFGSYTGNGSSDGPFVYCGFRPAMIICKKSSAAGNDWVIFDNQRDTYNVGNHQLKPNTSDAEFSGGTAHQWDFVSNGFKFKSTGSDINTSGATYVFMAFAQSPFKTANAR